MIEKVGLVISEAQAALIDSWELVRTNGILRNAENMEIVKHLKIVDLDAKSCWQELGNAVSRVLKENKKGFIIVGSVLIASVTAIEVYNYDKKKKELEEKCNNWINKAIKKYISSASEGTVDIDSISACEDALKSLPYITDKVFIALTQEDILELTNSLKEYTLSLARERNYCIKDKESLDYTGNVITCFLNNIQVQKEIISEVA